MKLRNNQLAVGLLCLLLSAATMAQVQTETKTSQGQTTVETTVERGEVVYVSGNDLVVKMEDGQIRNFSDVPESARVTVGGQQLSIHDLKPGMKLERTITTTSTPRTVTTVQTVTGRVWQARPPNSVTLTLADGSTEEFKIPEGQKFMVEGRETDAFGLKKGMEISATKIVTAPENVVSQQKTVTGEMPPPPPTAAIQGPLLIVIEAQPVQAKPAPAEVAQAKPPEAQPQPKKLPQTASELPVIGLVGTLVLLSGVALFWFCKRKSALTE
jgi:LPXTG-motif cell wall-anchored protein